MEFEITLSNYDLCVKLTVAFSKAGVKFILFNINESVIFYTVLHADVYMYMHFILEYNFDNLFFVLSFPRVFFFSLEEFCPSRDHPITIGIYLCSN